MSDSPVNQMVHITAVCLLQINVTPLIVVVCCEVTSGLAVPVESALLEPAR